MRKRNIKSIYSEEIYLLMGCDQRQFADYINKNYPKYKYTNGTGADGHMEEPVDDDGVKIFYLWIDEGNDKLVQRGAIIHECTHMVFALLTHVGIPLSVECDEAATYMMDDLTKQVFKLLKL
jgi:hypothetical protein